ncbi:MAG: hypothetical protein HUU54_03245 [Ignavibacteriaceae bacterium]|nr:hypothetical protein [Ignavibacteriaceae bacterium]
MKSVRIILLFLAIAAGIACAQEAFDWQTQSSKKNIKDAAVFGGGIWAGTEGGAFFYNKSDSTYTKLTKTEGLDGSPISAVFVDNLGTVWFGNQNGTIDVYNSSLNFRRRIIDIFSSNNSVKQVYSFEQKGDTLFISTDFGIVLINRANYKVIDTYSKLGNFTTKIKIKQTFRKGELFAATDFGIAKQLPGAVNLTAPESWTNYTTSQGLASANVTKIGAFRDTIIAATTAGFSAFNGSGWSDFLLPFRNKSITDFYVKGDSLLVLQGDKVFLYYAGALTEPFPFSFSNCTKIIGLDSYLYLAHKAGIYRVSTISANAGFLFPEGPFANQFLTLDTDEQGNLWVATGKDVAGIGAFKFDGFRWFNYNTSEVPGFPTNAIFNVHAARDGNVYFATWGRGYIKLDNNNNITHFYTNNTPLRGISSNSDYLVIADVKTDSRNNVWSLNHDAANQKTLAALTPDSTWHLFANYVDSTLNQYTKLIIDQFDTKWFLSSDPSRLGLFYFNENKTFGVKSDDRFGYLSNLSELFGKAISDIVVDQRGDLWIGTNLGVFYISNLSSFVTTASPSVRINSVFSLRQYSVNCIGVDPLNRKWIGTNQGLLLVSPDGSTLITYFDSKNSPLLNDIVRSITIDYKTGRVFVGMDGGMSVFSTYALEPETSLDNLILYPSPFIVGEDSKELTVDGLIRDSELKILSITGKLIRTIETPGGRVAKWNGRDEDGKLVNSGIYILIAYDKEGNNVSSKKLAVIRK